MVRSDRRGWFGRMLVRIRRRAVGLPRPAKRLIMLSADAIMIPSALITALWLKFGGATPDKVVVPVWLYAAALLVTVPIFTKLGLYRAVLRFLSARAAYTVFVGVTASVLLLAAINEFLLGESLPFTALAIYWALALVYVGGSRVVARQLLTQRSHEAERVAIFGAGAAGARLVASLNEGHGFVPVAIIDDNTTLHGSSIHGIEVYGPDSLPFLIDVYSVRRVLLAMPSIGQRRRREILASLESLGVYVQTVPDVSDIVSGHARIDDIRDVDPADLLGREPVAPDPQLFDACIRGKVVLVTGAGGSIGAELCRQIVELGPKRLVLLEMAELNLYNIDRDRFIANASVRNQCSHNYFYGDDCKLERAIKSVEDAYAHVVREILAPGYSLNDAGRLVLARFWLLQHLRTEEASRRTTEMTDGLRETARLLRAYVQTARW